MTSQYIDLRFGRSSYCGNGHCVEVAPLPDGQVAVRDSKDISSRLHVFTAAEWTAFIQGVKAGEFDFDVLPDSAESSPSR